MSDSYQSLFIETLQDALTECMAKVQHSGSLLPNELREEAWHLLSYAFRHPEIWQQTRELLLDISPRMELAGFREDWINYLQTAASRGASHNDLAATAEFEYQTGLLYRMLTDYERAKSWLNSSRERFAVLGDRGGQARVLNELAWIEQLRRNYDAATEHVDHALSLLDESAPERGMCYRVQGMIAIYQGHWEQAESYHRKALAIFERHNDQRKMAWAIQNIGFSLRGQERLEESIQCFRQATSMMSDLNDQYHLSIAQVNLGLAYYFSHLPSEAITYLLEAESKFAQFHDKLQLARVYTNLGLAYMMNGSNEKASSAFEHSIQAYHELGQTSLVINAMDGLAASYIAQKQYQSATEVINKALSLLPQIVSEPNYSYLEHSLNTHLQQTQNEQSFVFVAKANIS